jgi:hypothetical protein
VNGRDIAAGLDATAHCDNLSKQEAKTMATYYIFSIVYMLNGYEMTSQILTNSADKCYQLVRAAEEVSNVLPADLFCTDTGRISASIRPKLRPSTQSEAHQ